MDPAVSIGAGYTESKWVAERLTQLAAKASLRTQVIRVGLLTGGTNGVWDTSHWFPALAQSSAYLGCLPEGDDVSSFSSEKGKPTDLHLSRTSPGYQSMSQLEQ